MFIQIILAGSKFYSGTLPTMHSIYVYTDIYQGLKIFANSCIYIYIYGHVTSADLYARAQCGKFNLMASKFNIKVKMPKLFSNDLR